MGNKANPSPETLAKWTAILTEATEELNRKRADFDNADDYQRAMIRDAFDAGLSVYPISEATGLGISRLYQIKRGVRR